MGVYHNQQKLSISIPIHHKSILSHWDEQECYWHNNATKFHLYECTTQRLILEPKGGLRNMVGS